MQLNITKHHPIIFSTPMVQAILEGRKTQTRRTVKFPLTHPEYLLSIGENNEPPPVSFCKYGSVGDILWVRETWRHIHEGHYQWKASYPNKEGQAERQGWKPSIHMPKKACRLFLKITNIRVERLQDINEHDAESEGIELVEHNCFKNYDDSNPYQFIQDPIGSFRSLWQKINGLESWAANPWVWAISFEQINLNENEKMSFLSRV